MKNKVLILLMFIVIMSSICVSGCIYSGGKSTSGCTKFYDVAWNPDGNCALVVGEHWEYGKPYSNVILKYDGGNFIDLSDKSNHLPLYSIAWHPTGGYALMVGGDGAMLKYENGIITDLSSQTTTTNTLCDVAYQPTGDYALIVGAHGTLRKYDGNSVRPLVSNTTSNLCAVSFNPIEDYALILGYKYNDSSRKYSVTVFKYNNTSFKEINYRNATNISFELEAVTYAPEFDYKCLDISWCPNGKSALLIGGNTIIRYNNDNFINIPYTESDNKNYMDIAWKDDGSCCLITGYSSWFSTDKCIILMYHNETYTKLQTPSGYLFALGVNWKPNSGEALVVGYVHDYPMGYVDSRGIVWEYKEGTLTKIFEGHTHGYSRRTLYEVPEIGVVGAVGSIFLIVLGTMTYIRKRYNVKKGE